MSARAAGGDELDAGLLSEHLSTWTFEALTPIGRVDHHLWTMRTMPGGVPAFTVTMTRSLLDLPGVRITIDGAIAWEGGPMFMPDLHALAGGERPAEPDPDPDAARDDVLDNFDAALGGAE